MSFSYYYFLIIPLILTTLETSEIKSENLTALRLRVLLIVCKQVTVCPGHI